MTMPERILWSKLRRNALGVHFRRQHPVGHFTADFYCHEAWLVVEVDGRSTHDYHEAEDRARDAYLRAHGLEVIRFSASAVTKDVWQVVGTIRDVIARRLAAPSPKGEVPASSRAEGAPSSTASSSLSSSPDALVIGTMSPGPMLDSYERRALLTPAGARTRLIAPWLAATQRIGAPGDSVVAARLSA
jgi:very-short-patch-repair endonuclease